MFYWPGYRVSSLYGQRGDKFHKGVDFDGAIGDPINVASNGKVNDVGYSDSFGKYVVVEHYDVNGNVAGYTLYAHMDNYTVKKDQPLKKGDEIGQVGNTGAVDTSGGGDGSHLHFEVRPVDPNNPLTDVNGDGKVNWRDAEPVDPLTFTWDTFGGVYNYIYDHLFNGAKIPDSLSRYFTRATQWRPSREPLTLDLDGDGIETVGINTNNPILFDHDADGVKTATGWVKPDDALLVLDRNNNGVIDNGKELFGDSTQLSSGGNAADGFAALADLDSNADGQIDANDSQFANLKVWRDLNQDGISQANELSTLEQQNIASISLTTTQNNQLLPDGNRIVASFQLSAKHLKTEKWLLL